MALWQGASFTRGGAYLTYRRDVPRGEHERFEGVQGNQDG